jgi:hypothetical protein
MQRDRHLACGPLCRECPPSAPLRQRAAFAYGDFWIIVAARSEDETEIRAGKAAGGTRDQGTFGARHVATF